jgi:hypothetical protein
MATAEDEDATYDYIAISVEENRKEGYAIWTFFPSSIF